MFLEESLIERYRYHDARKFKSNELILCVIFALLIFGWVAAGLVIPKYSGEHCDCTRSLLQITNETDTFSVSYVVYCIDYPVYGKQSGEIDGFQTYEEASHFADSLNQDSLCCIDEDSYTVQDNKCKRTIFNIIWLILPLVSLTLSLVIALAFIVVHFTSSRKR
jgi:hypothetical protein